MAKKTTISKSKKTTGKQSSEVALEKNYGQRKAVKAKAKKAVAKVKKAFAKVKLLVKPMTAIVKAKPSAAKAKKTVTKAKAAPKLLFKKKKGTNDTGPKAR